MIILESVGQITMGLEKLELKRESVLGHHRTRTPASTNGLYAHQSGSRFSGAPHSSAKLTGKKTEVHRRGGKIVC